MKQIIVVTGASSGFGALAARALAHAGHTVYATMRETTGRNAPQVAEAARYAAEHGVDLRTVELDVASDASVEAGIAKVVADNGRLDVIVHNAGHMSFGPAEAFTPGQFAELFDINVLSTQRVNRAALPQLRKQGRGLVVWVSSSSARGGTPPYLSPYFAAKAAVEAMTSILAKELRGRNITVNAVAPGPTATDLFLTGKPQAVVDHLAKMAPLERLGQPDDIAATVAFLAGPDGAWINGQTLRANGGII